MKKLLLCLTLVCTLVSCKNDKDEKKADMPKIVSDKELLEGWKTYANDSIKVNIPSTWNPKKVEDVLLYVPLDKNGANLYYAVVKNDGLKISYKEYLKEIFKQISEKDKEFNYLITKINFEDNTYCYKIELFINEKTVKYKIYSLIYLNNGVIWDFSYKTINDENSNIDNYRTFNNVMFSFKFNNETIINGESFLVKNEEIIDYKDL